MKYDYKPINTKSPRTVYLDLNHKLLIPWEINPDAGGVDTIYCKIAGRMAWRINNEYFTEYEMAGCSECSELFDPETVCPQITVAGEEKGIRLVTLVR